jgi:uncharacterized membrane protein YgaE (UPF0421/DUF939 family)
VDWGFVKDRIRIFLNGLDFRIAIKTGIAASSSYFVAKEYAHFFNRPDLFLSGLWCVVTTIVVMQANVGGTYRAGWTRFLGIIIGSIFGALGVLYFGVTIPALGAAVAITIFVCSLLNIKEAYRIAGLSVAVVMLSWIVHPEASPWAIAFFRSLDATVGIFIAILVSHVVWPEQTWINIRNQLLKALQIAKTCYHNAVKVSAPKIYGHELSELFSLLTTLHDELEDTKLDFFAFGKERESWQIAVQRLDRLAESIAALQSIPKANLTNIFDTSLQWHVEKFIEETQNAFEELQAQCMEGASVGYSLTLQEQEQALSEDLERFRGTHLTRNFSIADVENFYSFFYHLHFIARQLYAIGMRSQK